MSAPSKSQVNKAGKVLRRWARGELTDPSAQRAALDSIDEVRRAQKRLSKIRPPLRVADYVDAPRVSGYRGVHVIVAYDDCPIEVQLRTRVMHDWAITVEDLSGRLEVDLKSGIGPQPVLDWLAATSEAMVAEKAGEAVTAEFANRLSELTVLAVPFLPGGSS